MNPSDAIQPGAIQLSPKLAPADIHNLQKSQRKMVTIFREFVRICDKYGLRFWCSGGTLIGVVRHQGWVPWDSDIDVCMLSADYDRLQTVISAELPPHLWFQDRNHTDKHYGAFCYVSGRIRDLQSQYKEISSLSYHNGLQLDIFAFDHNTEHNTLIFREMELQNFECYTKDREAETKNRACDIIFPVRSAEFEGIRVYVPNKVEEYCINAFGSYPPIMPPIECRYPHEGLTDPDEPSDFMSKQYPQLFERIKQK